jgi:hypothetical protein
MVNLSRQLKSKLKLLWVLIYSRLSRAPNTPHNGQVCGRSF